MIWLERSSQIEAGVSRTVSSYFSVYLGVGEALSCRRVEAGSGRQLIACEDPNKLQMSHPVLIEERYDLIACACPMAVCGVSRSGWISSPDGLNDFHMLRGRPNRFWT